MVEKYSVFSGRERKVLLLHRRGEDAQRHSRNPRKLTVGLRVAGEPQCLKAGAVHQRLHCRREDQTVQIRLQRLLERGMHFLLRRVPVRLRRVRV